MTTTPDETHPYFDPAKDGAAAPGTALAVVDRRQIELLLAPHTVDLMTWLGALLSTTEFPEQDAEQQTIGILASIIGADTAEAALSALNVQRAREMCGDKPGGRSDTLEIYDVRPLKSDYAEGAACYVIVQARNLKTGERLQFTTGARAVQAVLWKCKAENWMPVRCALEIRREKTRAGFYPLNLVAGV